jgi:hypothetical protein
LYCQIKNAQEISGGFHCDAGLEADFPRCCQTYPAVRKAFSH